MTVTIDQVTVNYGAAMNDLNGTTQSYHDDTPGWVVAVEYGVCVLWLVLIAYGLPLVCLWLGLGEGS